MALPTNIKTLLSGNVVEWARIEFKESWKPEASLKTICAFANDLDNWGGGYIVLGVEDDNGRPKLPIKGLDVSEVDDIMKDLLNKCKQTGRINGFEYYFDQIVSSRDWKRSL